MFDKLKGWFGKSANVNPAPTQPRPEPPPASSKKSTKTEKDIATEAGEPWVSIVKMDIDPVNLHQGAFELDWNDIFVARLVKAGYMMKPNDTDADIVDRWFQTICRNVIQENFEQWEANQDNRIIQRRDIGNGRTEVS